MGNKEWPDDWKVGNDAAWGCLMYPVAVVVAVVIAFILRRLLGLS